MCGANKLTGKLEVVLQQDEWISLFGCRTFKQRYVFMLSTQFVRASGNGVCSAPTRETQVEWKINHRNQGFENLFALCPIWSNIYIYILIICVCVCVCVCVSAWVGCLLPQGCTLNIVKVELLSWHCTCLLHDCQALLSISKSLNQL